MRNDAARAAARRLFPFWTRRMRAKWVVARMCVPATPRVDIGCKRPLVMSDYMFERVSR